MSKKLGSVPITMVCNYTMGTGGGVTSTTILQIDDVSNYDTLQIRGAGVMSPYITLHLYNGNTLLSSWTDKTERTISIKQYGIVSLRVAATSSNLINGTVNVYLTLV